MKRRLIYYSIYLVSVFLFVFLFIFLGILFTGSRESGMSYGGIVGYCFVQLVFPYFYLNRKILVSLITTVISLLVTFGIGKGIAYFILKFTSIEVTSGFFPYCLPILSIILPLIIYELAYYYFIKRKSQ